ncbi:hypothetical protein D3C71_1588500 [compost metagenome]
MEAVELIVSHTPVIELKTLLPAVEIDETIEFQIETAVFHIPVKIEVVEFQSCVNTPGIVVVKNAIVEEKTLTIEDHKPFTIFLNVSDF